MNVKKIRHHQQNLNQNQQQQQHQLIHQIHLHPQMSHQQAHIHQTLQIHPMIHQIHHIQKKVSNITKHNAEEEAEEDKIRLLFQSLSQFQDININKETVKHSFHKFHSQSHKHTATTTILTNITTISIIIKN